MLTAAWAAQSAPAAPRRVRRPATPVGPVMGELVRSRRCHGLPVVHVREAASAVVEGDLPRIRSSTARGGSEDQQQRREGWFRCGPA